MCHSMPHLHPRYKNGGKGMYDEIFGLSLPQLQKFVRASFAYIGKDRLAPAMQDFVAGLVQPCIDVVAFTVSNRTKEQTELGMKLMACLSSGQMAGISQAEIKIASSVACGGLRSHPLLQGLLVSSVSKAKRDNEGKPTMRRAIVCEDEQRLAVDAACTIALAGGNERVCRLLGAWGSLFCADILHFFFLIVFMF